MSLGILIIIGVIFAIGIAYWLLKSIVKAILLGGFIYLLFHIGFIWSADDLNEKLHLDKILTSEMNEKVQEKYSIFTDKRKEGEVVEAQLIKKLIDDSIAKATEDVKNVDKEKLIQDIAEKLKSFDRAETQKALESLSGELAKYNITPEEIEETFK